MPTALTPETKSVLKLNLGPKGTRRIAFQKLWDEDTSRVSYSRLIELALQYSNLDPENVELVITYLDEDGDHITISSNEELEDAFLQFVDKEPPVVRAVATTKSTVATIDSATATEAEAETGLIGITRHVLKERKWKGKGKGMDGKGPRPLRKLKERVHALEKIERQKQLSMEVMEMFDDQGHILFNRCSENQDGQQSKACPKVEVKSAHVQTSTIPKPLVTKAVCPQPPAVPHCWNDLVEPIPPAVPHCWNDLVEPIPPPKEFKIDCLNEDFIHGRHTCDGCFTTPVIGYRFHATNMPDYDLCFKCYKNYKGRDVAFQPEELDRDQYLQKRWKARQAMQERRSKNQQEGGDSCKTGSSRQCEGFDFKKAVNQVATGFCDAALTEAIKRSLEFEQKITEKLNKENSKSEPKSEPVPVAVPVDTAEKQKDEVEVVSNPVDREENKSNNSAVSVEDKVIEKVEVEDVTSLASEEENSVAEDESQVAPEPEFHIPSAPTHSPQVLIEPIETLQLQIETPQLQNDDNSGEKIIDGEEDDDAEIRSSVSSAGSDWEVLDEDGKSTSTDNMVAHAAQMLGSALFQSDMASENDGTGSGGESFLSGLTSIPSLKSKSEISSVLLSRWDQELRQLREFGFMDDHANVDALGHLEAANMGVSSDDPVTINAAVDYLLKQRKYEERDA
mmetsp:Transcript_430/g.630  ORF Transcript_430/g.630 Transcript_430/m.630 type:complete len:678 (-) Transcript_430:134-2167(-)